MGVQSWHIYAEKDIFIAVSLVKHTLKSAAFPEADQQKVLVSVAELTRNILDHGSRFGLISWQVVSNSIRITVEDNGPGIQNLSEILDTVAPRADAKGLGLGLSGTKRLMDEFAIESSERGTKVCVSKRNTSTQATINR
ncbi:ATP-binding protein [Alicyclobacillus sp. SO9]|uniref:ATP-binding protein n=1 Tax=Alicyclobacillus sp. SO9 TaxID=2665646 RepID=UPI0018E74010|nr:ATP-binding protein [Alicyclobacillus sp. SO9]QQE79962.1 ATP-binding protein [Alicyclobacillus sp. SO9]